LRTSISISLLLLAGAQGGQVRAYAQIATAEQVETGQLDYAGRTMTYRIRRLPLSAFPDMPLAVRNVLEGRQCMVPQTYEARRPENVIHGEFWQKGNRDWAVLCSRDGTSSLLVFRSSALSLPIELESGKDIDRLQARLNGTLGFAWGLDLAAAESVRRVAGKRSVSIDHDGIQVSIVEKSSEIQYNLNGTWLQFEGID
jgi:hypothetical protein